ncbi:MAG: hypothetical protein KQH83_08585 [Actinobacteria bacterium]|nr:hypothetical protein [Actinomycetota bacterium]
MADILGLDTLLAQIVLAVGAALAVGNGFAIWQATRGRRPKGEEGDLKPARAWFLLGIGLLMAYWGLASLLSG